MSTIPAELKYTETDEWIAIDGDVYTIGITDFAQDSLGDLVYVELPEVGDGVEAGEEFGNVESVKAVSPVVSPVTGEVVEINEALLDAPESINDDPYGAWLIRVGNVTEVEELLDAAAYASKCGEA